MSKKKKISVIELFAGVGGFRLGLEGWKGKSSTSNYKIPLTNRIPYQVIYSNQFEPSTKIQHANLIYESRFGLNGHFDIDVEDLHAEDIPKKCDLLVGGFPCPDFSVGALLKHSRGLEGDKGKLWYQITRIIEELIIKKRKPNYLLFENVDRMLKSPVREPGKDFDTILYTLNELGYNVEWKVINASDYGFPQKRKRVFMFCFDQESPISKYYNRYDDIEILENNGVISSAFNSKIDSEQPMSFDFVDDYIKPFEACGLMTKGKVSDFKGTPVYEGKNVSLGDVLFRGKIEETFYIDTRDIPKWQKAKGAKKILRKKGNHEYLWSEGKIPFPDNLNTASRTLITSEGGKSVSRVRHVVIDNKGRYRRLIPIELERLNMFPENFTLFEDIKDNKRAFLMGNALVVGIVEKIGTSLSRILDKN